MAETQYRIVRIAEEHIDGFRECVDAVALERQYLAILEAPAPEEVRKFVLDNIRSNAPQWIASAEGSVVGWCNVMVKPAADACAQLRAGHGGAP